jgi:predicted MPP superfamily phosphohydrolase
VVILHPSFLCPLLKKQGEALRFIVLADQRFYTTFEKSEGNDGKKGGPVLGAIVNRFLKLVPWGEVDKAKPADKPLFDTNDQAKENIAVDFLWQLGDLDDGLLTNKDEKPFAQMHPEVLKLYQNKGLVYGFEIELKKLPDEKPGLYDLSWMAYVRKDDTEEKKQGYFYELQDRYIAHYNTVYRDGFHPLKCSVDGNGTPVFEEEETEMQSYHPVYISNESELAIGHLSDVHVSSRQHVFTKSKARLIDGKPGTEAELLSEEIGPLVNTSYAVLKDLMDQMGNEVELLIFTGDLIDYNRNFNPHNSQKPIDKLEKSADIWQALDLKNLTDKKQYPIGIDNLTMYELFKWYYKTHNKPIMLVSGNHEAYTVPYGVSPRVKLLRSVAGNYFSGKWGVDFEGIPTLEYRKLTTDEVIAKSNEQAERDREEAARNENPDIYTDRANEGIAADHNLTIAEAILMYGPDYARVVMGASSDGGGERNFKPENMTWFYHIFTPLSSFVLTYGGQSFIGLGWGYDERFVGKKQGEWGLDGFLPRSTEGVSHSQLKIVEAALEEGKGKNLLCSHFTYVNYDVAQPICETGGVNFNNTFGSHSKFDYGTFEENRYQIYKLIKEHKVQYTLSGHSHRSGLYQITEDKSQWGRYNLNVKGQAAGKGKTFKAESGKCCMVVAACGGPIAVQNHANEFFNWGLDYPSGNVIKDGQISIVVPEVKQAKPRLAVALDYADIFLREKAKEKGGFFQTFESKENDGAFTLKIHPEANMADTDLFESIGLYFYTDDGLLHIRGSVTDEDGISKFMPDGMFDVTLDDAAKATKLAYIKIKLKPSTHEHLSKYNTDSAWVYPIQLYSRQALAMAELEENLRRIQLKSGIIPSGFAERQRNEVKKNVGGYIIDRHPIYGEVPDLKFYATLNDEYKIPD